jgi:hypothetical protein
MSQEKHNERLLEKRARIEAVLEAKKRKLMESEEKQRFSAIAKDSVDKEKRIKILEEKVDAMEKIINQLKLDFSRYRARNPSKGTKGIKG